MMMKGEFSYDRGRFQKGAPLSYTQVWYFTFIVPGNIGQFAGPRHDLGPEAPGKASEWGPTRRDLRRGTVRTHPPGAWPST